MTKPSKPKKRAKINVSDEGMKSHTDALLAHTFALKENTATLEALAELISGTEKGCCTVTYDGLKRDDQFPDYTKIRCVKKAKELGGTADWHPGECAQ
jgi:hypothetical protein